MPTPSAASTGTSSATSLTVAHTVSGSNKVLVACLCYGKSAASLSTSPTFNSVAMTLAKRQTSGSGTSKRTADVWYLIAPADATANFVATFDATVDSFVAITTLTSAAQASVVRGTGGQSTSTEDASATVLSESTDLVVDALTQITDDSLSDHVPGSGQTQLGDTVSASIRGSGSYKTGAAGSTTMIWSVDEGASESHNLVLAAASFKHQVGGSTTGGPRSMVIN